MEEHQEKPVTIEDIIFITKGMDGEEYSAFMELSGEERIEFTREKLKRLK